MNSIDKHCAVIRLNIYAATLSSPADVIQCVCVHVCALYIRIILHKYGPVTCDADMLDARSLMIWTIVGVLASARSRTRTSIFVIMNTMAVCSAVH